MKKRYLVTYVNRKIDHSEAVRLLGFSDKVVHEGVSFMAKDNLLKEDDALHFDKMGISSVGLTKEEADSLSIKDGILAVEEDLEMKILGFLSEDVGSELNEQPTNLWNIDLVKAPQAWEQGITGSGVNLAIIDTGIAAHPNLVISGGVSFVDGVSSYNDDQGHGTHCAGIAAGRNGLNKVYGVAPNCNLYAVKVLAGNGTGYTSWIISGMEWCVKNNIHVASMSLGGSNSPSIAYAAAIKNCEDNGVTVVCASGNEYQTSFPWVGSPANSYTEGDSNVSPVAVGAIDSDSVIAYFSSRGTNSNRWNPVTVVAPGVNIYSTYLNNSYKTMSGTSMACPHVAGLSVLIRQKYGNIAPNLVKAKASSSATNLGYSPFPNEAYGSGLINCYAAIL